MRFIIIKALITGANGFIGAHLCRKLLNEGLNVYAMIRETSNLSLLKKLNPSYNDINLVYGDLTDYNSLLLNLKDKDYVFNIAGVVKGLNQQDYDRVNVDGYINLYNALLEVNPNIKRVIMTSSIAAAGPSENSNLLTEESPPKFLKGDRYGKSKFTMEEKIKELNNGNEKKLPIVFIRPPTVLGPGDIPSLDLFSLPKRGFKLVVGKNKSYYSIVDVEDLCNGIYLCALKDKAIGEVFYFTSGEPIDWGKLQDVIGEQVFEKEFGTIKRIAISPKFALFIGRLMEFFGKIFNKTPFLNKPKMIEASNPYWCYSSNKAKKILGYKPKETIETTVRKAGEWYKQNGWL